MANSSGSIRMISTALVCCALVLGLACGDSVGPFETATQIHTQASQSWACVTLEGYTYCEYDWDAPDDATPEDNQGGDPGWEDCNYSDNGCEPCTYENDFCGDPGYPNPPPSSVNPANQADDEIYSCHSAWPVTCTLQPPDAAQRQRLINEIAKISTTHPYCAQIKQVAVDLLNRPAIAPNPAEGHPDGSPAGIQIWPEKVTVSEDGKTKTLYGDMQDRVIDYTLTVPEVHLWKEAIFARIVVHEVIHSLGGEHDGDNTYDGRTIAQWETTCVPSI